MTLASRIAGALKPEYVFQPRVLLRRLRTQRPPASGKQTFAIPGGATLFAEAREEHGRILATLGVVDLPVTEALWRLADEGEVGLDIGANIGYMTGVLGARSRGGEVHSFEALPTIFEDLQRNLEGFRDTFPNVRFQPHAVAVSDRPGRLRMELPTGFDANQGLARVAETGGIEVPAVTLDGVFADAAKIGVMKLDVEGHEISVLRGGERLFNEHRIRDCVFEEHRPYPSEVTTWLEARGYKVFRILRPLTGPKLGEPATTLADATWLPQNFLATRDEARTRSRFGPRGWKCLRD